MKMFDPMKVWVIIDEEVQPAYVFYLHRDGENVKLIVNGYAERLEIPPEKFYFTEVQALYSLVEMLKAQVERLTRALKGLDEGAC
jgi:hypothetical protein